MRGITQKVFIDFSFPMTRIATDRHPTPVSVDLRVYQQEAVGNRRDHTKKTDAGIRPFTSPIFFDSEDELQSFFRYLFEQIHFTPLPFFAQEVYLSLPTLLSPIETQAVITALSMAGAGSITVCAQSLSAGIGGDVAIATSRSSILIHTGYAHSEIAILAVSRCQELKAFSLKGNTCIDRLQDAIQLAFGMEVDTKSAEKILEEVSVLVEQEVSPEVTIKLPVSSLRKKENSIPISFCLDLMQEILKQPIFELQQFLLQRTPAQLLDVMDQGIILFGPSWLNRFLASQATRSLDLPVYLSTSAPTCIIKGLGVLAQTPARVRYTDV